MKSYRDNEIDKLYCIVTNRIGWATSFLLLCNARSIGVGKTSFGTDKKSHARNQ